MRFADGTETEAKTQEEVQDVAYRLVVTGSKYGVEINMDKSQIMRASRGNGSLKFKIRKWTKIN